MSKSKTNRQAKEIRCSSCGKFAFEEDTHTVLGELRRERLITELCSVGKMEVATPTLSERSWRTHRQRSTAYKTVEVVPNTLAAYNMLVLSMGVGVKYGSRREVSVSGKVSLELAFACDEPLIDVVFVHGLTGDATGTWQCPTDKSFWPKWLQNELQHLAIYTLGYPASIFEKWAKKEMDIFELAGNVLERFAQLGIGARPTVFVVHSLGGILTKILLRRSTESEDEDCKAVSEVTRLVIFLATPHTGSSLANTLSILPFSSKNIATLADDVGFLHDLNGQYRTYANGKPDLKTAVYYEKYKTKKSLVVVSRESADPGVSGTRPVAVEADHISICKPLDKDDFVYCGVRRHISKVLDGIVASMPGANGKFTGYDYTGKFDGDRRDLLEKLVDAGREHEYDYANSAQNRFARQFARTGLFTGAKEDHDNLLAQVEARFITHVYHPLICKGGSDEEIRTALQAHLVDPLVEKQVGGSKFSAKTILSALFFLTEQCHIRWDAPS